MCLCVCVHAQRHREREGGREKHKRRSWKDTTQQMQKPLRDLLAQRGGRKEERERERGRVEERSTPFTALHMWTCVSREQREQGVHTTLLTHSLTHSLPLSPLSPISSARERVRERKRGEKEKDTCKDLFFAMSFFFTLALPLVSFLPAPLPDTLLDKQEARPTQ